MAITISGENNNDRILAQDGVIDQISGINIVGLLTAGHVNVGSNIQLGNAGIITATTFVGNVTGNVNSTSPLLLQTGGSERFRITGNNELGIAGANYGSSGQVLTSGGSGSAVSWTTIPTQVTIANNANNRIITGGSGTNLNGEANMTFDGSQLVVQGGSGTQHMFRHSAGWGGVTSAGSAGGSGAGFSLANNYSGTLETKWSIYLDGSTDALRFTANTPDQTSDERLRITSDGKVGIGEDAPQQKLHLHEASSNGNFMVFTNSATGVTGNDGVLFGINSDEGGTIWNQENTYIRFGTSDTERLRITSGGDTELRNIVSGINNSSVSYTHLTLPTTPYV